MRCVDCKAKFDKEAMEAADNHCPECGHKVVAVLKQDGVSDLQLDKMVKQLAGEDNLPIVAGQLAYASMSRHRGRLRELPSFLWTALIIGIVTYLIFESWVAPLVVVLAVAGYQLVKSSPPGFSDRRRLCERFLTVNYNRDSTTEPNALNDTLGKACTRVLFCNSAPFVKFLVAAEFDLVNACPVIGPDCSTDRYPGLGERWRNDPSIKVIVVTDYTPRGIDFFAQLEELVEDSANVHHVGLDDNWVATMKAPRRRSVEELRGAKPNEAFGRHYVELLAIPPVLVLAGLATSLDSLAFPPPTEGGGELDLGYEDDSE